MKIFFDVKHYYYLPQYQPVAAALNQRGVTPRFIIHHQQEWQPVIVDQMRALGADFIIVDNESAAVELYRNEQPNWVIFGNACATADQLHPHSRTALMQHGIGPKSCYYDVSECPIQVRFVEGTHRLQRLQERFPDKLFIDTGYAKLDPLIQGNTTGLDLKNLGLDPSKPTLLYAPTFYPSSIECLPMDWPAALPELNILIKPHFFSLTKSAYSKQRRRFKQWQQHSNVHIAALEETNLLPFMASADLLVSDASSSLFEFVALGKPAIWSDFYKLRWSYRGPLKFRFKGRMDPDLEWFSKVATRIQQPGQLIAAIQKAVKNGYDPEPEIASTIFQLAGRVDGRCSERIVDYLLEEPPSCA